MLTPEQQELLRRHVYIDGDGNVVGNDNTVQVMRVNTETYTIEVNERYITFTVDELRNIQESQVGVLGNHTTVHGGMHFYQHVAPSLSRAPIPQYPRVNHNLPQPDYGEFVGRKEELTEVHRLLRPYPHSQHSVVTIDGIGGIGKSALALEAAYHYLRNHDQLPEEERFDAIIWTSAKTSVLTAEGIAPRQQVARTLDDIYTAIAVTLDREEITRARSEEQGMLTTKALTRQRTLLIVDNLETVEDERVNAFLRELPAPTKAIVTTRHRIDVAYPIRLTGMPEEDALKLIVHECNKKSVFLTQAEARMLYQRTGGVPLAMVWSVAQMGYGHDIATVLQRLEQPTGDIARFCFEGAMAIIRSKPAHYLLMALALFAADASREALKYVVNAPEMNCNNELVELTKLSLINRATPQPPRRNEDLALYLRRILPSVSADTRSVDYQILRYSMLPMTRQFTLFDLAQRKSLRSEFEVRQARYYKDFLSRHRIKPQTMDLMKIEQANIAVVLRRLILSGSFDLAVSIFRHYYPFLWRQGHWSEGIELAQQVLDWAEMQRADKLQARCSHWLGRLHLYQGQYAQAESYLKNSSRLYSQSDWQWISVQTYLAQTFLRQGHLQTASATLEAALPVALQREDHRGATKIYNVFAEIELSKAPPQLNQAMQFVQMGYDLAEGRNEQTTVLGKNFYLRGKTLRLQGHLEEAGEWIVRYVSIADKEDFVQERAQGLLELAMIARLEGNTAEAKLLAHNIIDVFERLGMKRELKECRELIDELPGDIEEN